MFHSRRINNKANHLHERSLCVIKTRLHSLRNNRKKMGLSHYTIAIFRFVTEIFKVYNNIAPPIFTEVFSKPNLNHELRHTTHFSVPPVWSTYNRTESQSFLGPKTWDIMPTRLKEVTTLRALKSRIKKLAMQALWKVYKLKKDTQRCYDVLLSWICSWSP